MKQRHPTGSDLFGEIMEAEKQGKSWDPYGSDLACTPASAADGKASRRELKMMLRDFVRRLRGLSPRAWAVVAGVVVCAVLLYFFPVYRAFTVLTGEYFEPEEVKMLLVRGTPWDLWEAREIIALGRAAFEDTTTPCDQHGEDDPRRALHGELWRHVTGPDQRKGKYTLRLLSAHLGKDKGYVWIEYSQESLDEKGEYIYGSDYKYQELWIVQRDAQGRWQVVDTKWHP